MVYKGKKLTNSYSGQQLVFLRTAAETNGSMLEMEMTLMGNSPEPPLHYHPLQSEEFRILTGKLTVRMGDNVREYGKGQYFAIPSRTPHSMWNAGAEAVVVNWKVQPALETAEFFEQAYNLGKPGLIDKIALARKYAHVFRLSKPHPVMLWLLYILVYPMIWLKKKC
ncbi:cupin domain-containing protein [Flavihumibacter petaseus]|uniref:PI-PLC Y-box domain-containing protein n=1 Tax=Flavihumibacter petaseus NBRC 106054 TaxID=1220578 RepID=A0A0E9MY97_9BACT|nr:cupin domain-containing protein [Flavihumibacter petaseus]GAO42473.1 hypothetical protein FPE01S_01_14870 [Flavihumibacter petaseus NBRC 106054]